MSFQSETPQMNRRKSARRMPPSIRLKMMRPPRAGSIFLSSVAATSGSHLYMKMKKASERMMLMAASQLLRVAAFSRVADWEDAEELGTGGCSRSASLRPFDELRAGFGGTGEAPVATWVVPASTRFVLA